MGAEMPANELELSENWWERNGLFPWLSLRYVPGTFNTSIGLVGGAMIVFMATALVTVVRYYL